MSDRMRIALMLAPAMLVIAVLFVGGTGALVLRSLGYMPLIGLHEPSLDAYAAILSAPEFYASLGLSLYISITSTLLSAVLAVLAALLLRRGFAGGRLVTYLFQLNLTVPHLIGAIGILALFSQSGSLARIGFHAGMLAKPADFPVLVNDPYAIGIIAQYVWKEVPFIGLIVLAMLQSLGDDLEAVARTLGASRWQSFRYVLLPQLLPGVVSASALVFAFTFGAYEIPALLGQNHPVALPVLAMRAFTSVDLADRPEAMAMALVIAALGASMVWLVFRFAPGGRQ